MLKMILPIRKGKGSTWSGDLVIGYVAQFVNRANPSDNFTRVYDIQPMDVEFINSYGEVVLRAFDKSFKLVDPESVTFDEEI